MKTKIINLLKATLQKAMETGRLLPVSLPSFVVEEPKHKHHGDFSTNTAMLLASSQKKASRDIAGIICECIEDSAGMIDKTVIAGPGFINFFIKPSAFLAVLQQVHQLDYTYGAGHIGHGVKVQVEFVSANPTGPLHVGHGRGAAIGDSVAEILKFCGYEVQREYYLNDCGRQIQTLGLSVFLRYQELCGLIQPFPEDCYQGDYIRALAVTLKADQNEELIKMKKDEAIAKCGSYAASQILSKIRTDLEDFRVNFDNWFSEQSLFDKGKVQALLDQMQEKNIIYSQDQALWFRSSAFGDEKDRVVLRSNGQSTYFASDIAYHDDKFKRGFERVIDVWGADHHGYIDRMTAAVEAMGRSRSDFKVILVQLVNLLRNGEPVGMSTRAGEFVTLADVIKEVGTDAARFIFLMRHYESPLDFDLEVAKQKNNDNPVYYVQYVYARISSIIKKAAEDGLPADDKTFIDRLLDPREIQLMKLLWRFPDEVLNSAKMMEPHRISFYLREIAAGFHAYYNHCRVLTEDQPLSRARLYLIAAVRIVIRNGLSLLGVSTPEKM